MRSITVNPWHGCHKYSEGCLNCYVYRRDNSIGKDASIVTITSSFNDLIAKKRDGSYKIKANYRVFLCMTSDFFLEEMQQERIRQWEMIKERSDLEIFIITKRIKNFYSGLPSDFPNGYSHVHIMCTIENQKQCDNRLDYFLSLPIVHKHINCEPLLTKIDFHNKLIGIDSITVGGESGPNARICDYRWVLDIRQQCINQHIPFHFKQTGANFLKNNTLYKIDRKYQQFQAKKANIDY